MHAIIRKSDTAVIGTLPGLPGRFRLDDGTTVDFSAPGGLETDTLRCLPVTDAAPPDQRTHRRTGAPVITTDGTTAVREWTLEALPLETVRAQALHRLRARRLARETWAATGDADAPTGMLSLYMSKEMWARNHQLGNTGFDALLQAEASVHGVSVDDLAITIVTKADVARAAVAAIEGVHAAAVADVAAAATVEAILSAEAAGIAAIDAVGA